MAKKKEYYIPTIEIMSVRTQEMMWDLEGSGSKEQPTSAPQRREEVVFF